MCLDTCCERVASIDKIFPNDSRVFVSCETNFCLSMIKDVGCVFRLSVMCVGIDCQGYGGSMENSL